jgi:hypothetical protein
MAERMRELVDETELIEIAMSIARGDPMVRIVDPKTNRPRVATTKTRPDRDTAPGQSRPDPVSLLKEGEVIHDIHWVTTAERMSALTWIRETCGIKAPVPTEVDMKVSHGPEIVGEIDYSRLSAEELDAYIALTDKVIARLPSGEPEKEPEE